MKYLDEFRNVESAKRLIAEIRGRLTRRWTLMEVCGGQTHSLMRHGIAEELSDAIDLLHGPGCPVCVTASEAIDWAIDLSLREDFILATFGDMLRVPGTVGSLAKARAHGGTVRTVYSPLDAVALAQRHPGKQVVFFAVGFETTAPATALAVRQAAQLKLKNFSLLAMHVRVLPAMQRLLSDPAAHIDGFLAAGHVCTITGSAAYTEIIERFGVPVVVTGFEPIDLLVGILECVMLLESGTPAVRNCYARTAADAGNLAAQQLVDEVYEVCNRQWRGFGVLEQGGLRLRPQWSTFDALQRYAPLREPNADDSLCPSAMVLSGRMKPHECESFGSACTPEHPLGAPMVSSEGACAAYFRYARHRSLNAG